MHSRTHMPTCFKYGKSKKCRARFPRKIVAESSFDPDTGVISIRRNHSWVNNYNKWIAMMIRMNHDCQMLFTKKHALATIHYVMKYITKAETALHSKLTIAAAVRKAFTTISTHTTDIGKSMLLKVYNKMDGYRKVGVPEAISYLLDYSDHYTDAFYANVHTTHLLNHLKRSSRRQNPAEIQNNDQFDSEIIVSNNGRLSLASLFTDYVYRGPTLQNYCLYDYCSVVYKEKNTPGLPFLSEHPQYGSHRQIIRKLSSIIPTPLGNLLFLDKASKKDTEREDYYCIVAGLFFPWTGEHSMKGDDESWEQWFHDNESTLSPRLRHHIDNLDLLHKTKEDTRIDQLQRRVQEAEYDGDDAPAGNGNMDSIMDMDMDIAEHDGISLPIEQAIQQLDNDSSDFYTLDGIQASQENGYFASDTGPSEAMLDDNDVHYSPLPLEFVQQAFKSLSASVPTNTIPVQRQSETSPTVYLTNGDEQDNAILKIIDDFILNTKQALAFRIIAEYTLGRSKVGDQLLMGLFGEAGTGKSRIINAIRAWFRTIGREYELVITAIIGAAAFEIRGATLHSSLGIAVEKGDKPVKMSREKRAQWEAPRYLIIDEVSMMGSSLMMKLNDKLCIAKSSKASEIFGGINILFVGDFLQLPSPSSDRVYKSRPRYRRGCDLWRSSNAVVILDEQMRQAEDPRAAELLHRMRYRKPTQADLDLLASRIGAHLDDPDITPIVVRRHQLRHRLNMRRLELFAAKTRCPITYCVANVRSRSGMSLSHAYRTRYGQKDVKGDAIIPLVPGAPLMLTKNINSNLGKSLFCFNKLIHFRSGQWRHRQILWFWTSGTYRQLCHSFTPYVHVGQSSP